MAAARARSVAVHPESVGAHVERTGPLYDLVCAFEVLEHVARPREFLLDCCRALEPGGRLVVSVPSAQSFYPFVVNELLNLPPHHLTRWTDRALGNLAPLLGVEVEGLEAPSILRSGHGRLYLAHLFENAEIERLGIDAVGGVCVDPRFEDIRARARARGSAEALLAAVRDELQMPRGITVCATFRVPDRA